jgi:hypothetical protein
MEEEYQKLLSLGVAKLKNESDNDLEKHTYKNINQLLLLNKYVYTYYSTNAEDKTYSIEFAILPQYLEPLMNKLKEKGYWFQTKNYKTGQYIAYYDKYLVKNSFYISEKIIEKSISYLFQESWEFPADWMSLDKFKIKKILPVYLFESIEQFMFNTGMNVFQQIYVDDDTFTNINTQLLSENIAVVMIEDPIIDRKTLYLELYDILQTII